MLKETKMDAANLDELRALSRKMHAEDRERQKTCKHEDYSFEKHGRCCWTCGIFMVDWGD